jgi:hypothetical protein
MVHIIRVVYNKEILRRGVRAFIWHRVVRGMGWIGFIAFALMIATSFLMDGAGWMNYACLAVIIIVALIVGAGYYVNLRLKLARFRQMDDPAVTMKMEEDGFEVVSSLGQSSANWDSLESILKKPEFWLLFTKNGQFIVLPIEDIPQESLGYLERKIAGGAKPAVE